VTKHFFKAAAFIGIVLIILAPLWWFTRNHTVTRNFFAMGTFFEITATGRFPEKTIDKAVAEIERIESLTKPGGDSDISRINQNAGISPVKIASETLEILQLVRAHYQALSGAFDPTIAPLIDLWGFNSNGLPHRPEKSQIASLLPLVNFKNVTIHPSRQTVHLTQPGMKLDLGGIAKGYAIDRAYQILQADGIHSALINGGTSSIRIIGKKESKRHWILGIGHPRHENQLLGTLTLPNNRALSTSADTQNFFLEEGIRYSHLIDPATGYPARDKILVTVTAPTTVEADLLSTAFFILPLHQIQTYVKNRPDIGVIIFDAAQRLTVINEPNFSATTEN